jgi:hypothetical protein
MIQNTSTGKSDLECVQQGYGVNGGYVGIENVDSKDGWVIAFWTMLSFFFAEILRHLYLTFDNPEKLSLDKCESHLFTSLFWY